MRVLLISPSSSSSDKKVLGEFYFPAVPLGICYIAAMLELDGFEASILDMSLPQVRPERLKEKLAQEKPEVVGITSMTSNFLHALAIARTVKQLSPESLVVMGGVHATFMHKEILASVPEVDIVVRFEGEFTMSELAKASEAGRDLRKVEGISFREEGRVVSTPLRKPIEDLDCLPYPAFHLLEPSFEEYVSSYAKRSFPVITTRGCPFGCIYCSTMAFHGRKYRTRSVSGVIAELEFLVNKYKAENISFLDDNFTIQENRVSALCKELKNKDLSLTWGCSARADQLSDELLGVMKEAGCEDIFFGVESASNRVLKIIKKGFRVQQAKSAVKVAEKLGIRTHCSFVIGLPGETTRSLRNMAKFVIETKPSGRVLPNRLVVFPGTELYKNLNDYDLSELSSANMTRAQIEVLMEFYKINYKLDELFRVVPPNIAIE